MRVLRRRRDGPPIILLTARSVTAERVAGVDAGADDYLTKSFEMDELEARLRVTARRTDLEFTESETLGPMVFDRAGRLLLRDGERLDLARKEIASLECLLERRGRLASKLRRISHFYGTGSSAGESAIEPHVSRLKPFGIRIKTARRLGYMLDVDAR
ncbi:response regulator [Litorisediminicola beolgyonensis]|uniref:Response regulator n=1 Tax=Litorisediminicola beolgyonensis TaxID=1173614 RepID=A0ABW3ZNQ1_9RHOB